MKCNHRLTDANNLTDKSMTKFLAPKRNGFRISAGGVLRRIQNGNRGAELNYACGEMLRHLEEMATRYYAGDVQVVDEFLQLYCLDDARPNK